MAKNKREVASLLRSTFELQLKIRLQRRNLYNRVCDCDEVYDNNIEDTGAGGTAVFLKKLQNRV